MGRVSAPGAVPVVLVQHAHQALITDGYDSREGVHELAAALSGLVRCHLETRTPLALHVSGTLTEALAWHVPEVALLVRRLDDEGLLELVGSAYAQNVMTLFGPEHNRRQLAEALRLYARHYGVAPERVRSLWVPERVWDTALLADVVTDPDLPNGGYDLLLLDDRHAYRQGAERAAFDAGSSPARGSGCPDREWGRPAGDGRHLRPFGLLGTALRVLPVSGDLRYAVPSCGPDADALLDRAVAEARQAGPAAVLCYGDDAEKCARTGPWAPPGWEAGRLADYRRSLARLARPDVEVTLPQQVLRRSRDAAPLVPREVDPATFYEIAVPGGAGERYDGWADDPGWAQYRARLEAVEAALVGCGPGEPGGVLDAAWVQLMVSCYETAWHDVDGGGARVAPWARAVAAHCRDVLPLLDAVHRPRADRAVAALHDVDGDGEVEVVLRNAAWHVVLSPRHGGRLVCALDLRPAGGRVVVGNSADDWNWQEGSGFMQQPRNHVGAFADVGYESDAWEVVETVRDAEGFRVVLVDVEAGSPLAGSTKTFRMPDEGAALRVEYALTDRVPGLLVDVALSPDYLRLLREGRAPLTPLRDPERDRWRGWAAGDVGVWLEPEPGGPVVWDASAASCGHAEVLRVAAYGPRFAVTLLAGPPAGAGAVPTAPAARQATA